MDTLANLQGVLQSRIKAGALLLSADVEGLGTLAPFLSLFEGGQLSMTACSLSLSTGEDAALTVTGKVGAELPILDNADSPRVALYSLVLSITVDEREQDFVCQAHMPKGALPVAEAVLVCNGYYDGAGRLQWTTGKGLAWALPDFMTWAGDSDLMDSVPTVIAALPNVTVDSWVLTKVLQSTPASEFALSLAVPQKTLEVIPGVLVLATPTISLQVIHFSRQVPVDAEQSRMELAWASSLSGVVSGTATLGTALSWRASFNGSGIWDFAVAAAAGTALPSVDDVAAWVGQHAPGGVATLAADLDALLQGLGLDLDLESLAAQVDWATPALRGAQVQAKATLFGASLEARLDLPSMALSAWLPEGAPLSLTDLAKGFWDKADVLPDLSVSDFQLVLNAAAKSFALDVTVTDDWVFHLHDNEMALSSVSFSFAKTLASGGGAATVTASVAGLVELSGVYFALQASYDPSSGWSFAGGALADEPVDLNAFCNGLLSMIDLSVPTEVPKIMVQQLHLTYQLKSGALSFVCETVAPGQVPLGTNIHDVHTMVSMESVIDEESGNRTFSGQFEGDVTIGQEKITVSYALASGANVFDASWQATGDASIDFSDLLEGLGFSDPLAGIDHAVSSALALTELAFEYRVDDALFVLSAVSKTLGKAFLVAGPTGASFNSPWGFLVGVELEKDLSFSKLPGVSSVAKDVDLSVVDELLHVQGATILIASATFTKFTLPVLPALPTAEAGAEGAAPQPMQPLLAGALLTVDPGLSFAVEVDLMGPKGVTHHSPVVANLQKVLDVEYLMLQVGITTKGFEIAAALQGHITIPSVAGSLSLGDPLVMLKINGKVVLLKLQGSMTLDVGSKEVTAKADITIDEAEAQVDVSIESKNGKSKDKSKDKESYTGLGIRNLYLDQIGLQMGIIFEPPGVDVGIQGQWHFEGDPTPSNGGQRDEFAFVFELVEEIPDPMLLIFHMENYSLATVLKLLTGFEAPSVFDSEHIAMSNLDLYWSESILVLPNGTVATPGIGFGGTIHLYGFQAHAAIKVDLYEGFLGEAEIPPIHLWDILSITGTGQGISKEFVTLPDGTRQEVNNVTALNDKTAGKKPPATEKVVLVEAGGPVFHVGTSGPEYVKVSWHVQLFETLAEDLELEVTADGVQFDFDYELTDSLQITLACTVAIDGEAAAQTEILALDGLATQAQRDLISFDAKASFDFGLDAQIDPGSILGYDLGSLDLDVVFKVNALELKLDMVTGFLLSIDAEFDFEGEMIPFSYKWTRGVADLEKGVGDAIASLQDLPDLIVQELEDNFGSYFSALVKDLSGVLGEIESYGEEVGEATAKTLQAMADKAKQTIEDYEKQAEAFAKAASAKIDNLQKDITAIEQQAKQILTDAEAEVAAIGVKTKEVVEGIVHEGEVVLQDAEKLAGEVEKSLTDFENQVAADIAAMTSAAEAEVKAIGDAVAKEVHQLLEDARAVAAKLLGDASAEVRQLEHEAEAVWGEVKNLADKAAHAIKKGAEDAWDTVKHY